MSTCKKITKKKISLKGIENYNMQINHNKYQILRNLRVRWEEFEIKHDNSLTQLRYVVPDVPTLKLYGYSFGTNQIKCWDVYLVIPMGCFGR